MLEYEENRVLGKGTLAFIPKELEKTRKLAFKAIAPIKYADEATNNSEYFLMTAGKTDEGDELPPYYLVYFLLVDLLGFENIGRFEKVAWSIPLDFNGRAFLIEYRKLGLGLFAHNPEKEKKQDRQIVQLIKKGVKAATPYYNWLAEKAFQESKLNVVNNSYHLYNRFEYFLKSYLSTKKETEEKRQKTRGTIEKNLSSYNESLILRNHANWLALAAIDAFFSWTKHVFIHIAIISGFISSGKEVAELANKEWKDKFKKILDIDNPQTKEFYDQLIEIRKQLRNYIAHGAFGKKREAFKFHSSAGAVPVTLTQKTGKWKYAFSIIETNAFDDDKAFEIIENFLNYLWSGTRTPAYHYIQKSGLPLILTMAADGTYKKAMQSLESMNSFIEYQSYLCDMHANMDW